MATPDQNDQPNQAAIVRLQVAGGGDLHVARVERFLGDLEHRPPYHPHAGRQLARAPGPVLSVDQHEAVCH
jgi:hypothetical protein